MVVDRLRSISFDGPIEFVHPENQLVVPPGMRDELDRAIDRQRWLESQLDACNNWLVNSGFPLELEEIDREKLDKLFSTYFRKREAPKLSIPTRSTAEEFVRQYFTSTEGPALVNCRVKSRERFRGGRDIIDAAYRKLAPEYDVPLTPGPRIVRKNSAE